MTNYVNQKVSLSAAQYFLLVAIASIALATLWFFSNPILVQKSKVAVGVMPSFDANDNSFYQQRVQLVFDKYCVDCHNEEKSKGKLRLDAFAFTRYSGKSGNTVIAGDAEKSELLARMLLPDDDKRLMPPLGWKHPTDDELKVLTMWINKGASSSRTSEEFSDAPDLIKEVEIPTIDSKQVQSLRSPILTSFYNINNLYPYSLSYISRGTNHLHFTNVSTKQTFGDSDFKNLLPVANHLHSLYLRNTKLSDASIAVLEKMINLKELYIVGADFSATGLLQMINAVPNLKRLTLNNLDIDEATKNLCADKNIKLSGVSRG
jgi:hypothetical protein